MKPAASIMGMTHQVNTAPPISSTSMRFIATSIETMDIIDMPKAVLNAVLMVICLLRTIVSNRIEVRRPITIARHIIISVGQ